MKKAGFIACFLFLLGSKIFCQSIITTVAGTGTAGYSGDNALASNALINHPRGLNFDKNGNYYFADLVNNVIRKVNINDTIITIAGTGNTTYNGDNILAINANICPINGTPDNNGNIYISDQCNHRIRKINPLGIITTIAGTNTGGYSGDNGPAVNAQTIGPGLVMIDKFGNIIFTDFIANVVRKIALSDTITTIVGTGTAGASGDNGPATAAQLNGPYAIAQDTAGNFYISDQLNNLIRKIDKAGIITTIAGTGAQGYSGDNGPAINAKLYNPAQIAIDDTGNVFFADYANSVIRKIDLNGIITTVAGNGTVGYSGDNGPATNAQLRHAWGIALNRNGDLYIADEGNNVIRKVTHVGVMSVKKQTEKNSLFSIYPNPNNGNFIISTKQTGGKELKADVYNAMGQVVLSKTFNAVNQNEFKIEGLSEGIYIVKLALDGTATGSQKLIVSP